MSVNFGIPEVASIRLAKRSSHGPRAFGGNAAAADRDVGQGGGGEREHRRESIAGAHQACRQTGDSQMMKPLAIIAALMLSILPALAQPLPQPKPKPKPKPPGPGGSCPHGYTSSGSFCVPSRGAQDAIAKPPNGTCPWSWISSGSYCPRSGNVRR
jgi:hypothetical protein